MLTRIRGSWYVLPLTFAGILSLVQRLARAPLLPAREEGRRQVSLPSIVSMSRHSYRVVPLMVKLPRRDCSLRWLLLAAAIASAVLVFGGAGCAGRRYTTRNLPAKYLAPHTEKVEETGLRNLHVPPVNGKLIDLGDVLEVTIVTSFGNLNTPTIPARVERDGSTNIPLIGASPWPG